MKNLAFRNKKGVELSINMLVIVALAVFALFLIIGFVLGGFGFFRSLFGEVTKQKPEELAQINCERSLTGWKNTGSPDIAGSRWEDELCKQRYDIDFNNDGIKGLDANGDPKDAADSYSCSPQYVRAPC